MNANVKGLLLPALLWAASSRVHAHGFEERYDLPVPLAYVVIAACAAVLLTFVVAAVLLRRPLAPPVAAPAPPAPTPAGPLSWAGKAVAVFLLGLTLAAALFGSADPLMNLAPTLIWIVWWIGLSFVVLLLGNLWPALDPWRTSFDVLDAIARRLGRTQGLALGWCWPVWLGAWSAVLLLLLWSWLEVVYPLATTPFKLGCTAVLWSLINLAGMAGFGPDRWQARADLFAVYFALLGRMAPLQWQDGRAVFAWRSPAWGALRIQPLQTAGQVGFAVAMLSTVLFDGLHGGAGWLLFEAALRHLAPQWMDVNGYVAGTLGLLTVWLVFMLAYGLACRLSAALTQTAGLPLAARFAPTLIPIAAAYLVAHNFSNLLIQGQTVLQLLSDPFGRQWNLFGTAQWYPDIGLVDARLTWYVAVSAIVLGHVASVWLTHRIAWTLGLSAKRTLLASIPLTVLMIAYTALSLIVIAEPMVNAP